MSPRLSARLGGGHRAIFSFVCLIILSVSAIGAGPVPPRPPTPQAPPPASLGTAGSMSPTTTNPAPTIDAYHLITPDLGWLVMGNQLYQTQTGGQTWNVITPPGLGNYQIRAATFLDGRAGWLILTSASADGGVNYVLARTTDGGHTWQQRVQPLFAPGDVAAQASAAYLQFLDAQTGWLVVRQATSNNFRLGTLFRTSDGGDTWTRLSLPVGEPVRFVTTEVGWTAGGAAGTELYRTLDGGQTWSPHIPGSLASSQPLYQLPSFSDVRTGLLPVVTITDDQILVEFHQTQDGGATWQKAAQVALQATDPVAVPVSIVDTQHWIVLDPATQRLTRWSAQAATSIVTSLPASAHLASLDMVSPEIGWALNTVNRCSRQPAIAAGATVQTLGECVQEIQLLRTGNGGQDWEALPLPPAGVTTLAETSSFVIQTQPNAPSGLSLQTLGGRTRTLMGQGFDACNLPGLAALTDWSAHSPYKAVNLYLGGPQRACANTLLNAAYLTQLTQLGWTFIPTWVGPQAACSRFSSRMSEDPDTAFTQGATEANTAINAAANLGLTLADKSGTIIYYDLEGYPVDDMKCRDAAKSFISGWTAQLHSTGNQAGVYGGAASSALSDFVGIPNIPDAVWMAAWLLPAQYRADVTVWLTRYVDNSLWSSHQRIRQYAGDHDETWGGTALSIDSNVIDGIVATLADNTPPTVQTQLYLLYPNSPFLDFRVLFNGSDDLSGIAAYDLQYEVDGDHHWRDAITDTAQAEYQFVAPAYGHTYGFRARARDRAGNQGDYPATADFTHTVPAYCGALVDLAEPNNNSTEAKPLILGDPAQEHNFQVPGDQDWFTLALQANTVYMIATSNLGGFADTVITLFAPDAATVLAENDDDPGNWPASRLVWRPTLTGTYYLKVVHFDSYGYGCYTTYGLSAVRTRQVFLPNIRRP